MAGKKKDMSPSRGNYWSSRRLEKKKIRNIMKNKGCSLEEATKIWVEGVESHPKTKVVHEGNKTTRQVMVGPKGTVMTKVVKGRTKRKK